MVQLSGWSSYPARLWMASQNRASMKGDSLLSQAVGLTCLGCRSSSHLVTCPPLSLASPQQVCGKCRWRQWRQRAQIHTCLLGYMCFFGARDFIKSAVIHSVRVVHICPLLHICLVACARHCVLDARVDCCTFALLVVATRRSMLLLWKAGVGP